MQPGRFGLHPGVHGYQLCAEFEYFCDACGHSENAEFKSSPVQNDTKRRPARRRYVTPERLDFDEVDHDYFRPTYFKRSLRAKSI